MRFLRLLVLSLCLFLSLTQVSGQQTVFLSGADRYKSYRIPAIVRAPDGTLLAFAEGRVSDSKDFGDIDIVMRRSSDKGKTWSQVQAVATYDTLQAGNPSPVFDLTDPAYPKGRLFLFYNTGNNHEGEVRKGKGFREVWYKTSTDAGLSWSVPVNITRQVHRPKQPQHNPEYNFQEDWRSYANAPGHGMQFLSGKYKGRIFIPANHSQGEPKPHFTDYRAHGFYTDDHGKTFKISASLPVEGSNESTATEISGGRLMMNSRNQQGNIKLRIVAVSGDGGAKWDTIYFDKNLPDPVNEGSILTVGKTKTHHILAFANAANTRQRDNLTLRISYDDGKTWDKKILVDQSSNGEQDYTAYSDIVQTGPGTIGILYELNGYKSIVYKEINWKDQ